MLVKETITLDERELTHIWSDKNMLIRNVDTGELYSDVIDPIDIIRFYEETDIQDDADDDTQS